MLGDEPRTGDEHDGEADHEEQGDGPGHSLAPESHPRHVDDQQRLRAEHADDGRRHPGSPAAVEVGLVVRGRTCATSTSAAAPSAPAPA